MDIARLFRGLQDVFPGSRGEQLYPRAVADTIVPVALVPGPWDWAERITAQQFVGGAGEAFVNGPVAGANEVIYVHAAQCFHNDGVSHRLMLFCRQNNTTLTTALGPFAPLLVAANEIQSFGRTAIIPPGFIPRWGVVDAAAFGGAAVMTMTVQFARLSFQTLALPQ